MNSQPVISIVVPLYNEEETMPVLLERLNKVMDGFPSLIETVLVDDGSRDGTALAMRVAAEQDSRYHAVFLSRNFGHQVAVTAGLACARGSEGVFIIDGDLQDPPELLPQFYAKMKEGYDVVYAIRTKRKEGFLKRAAYKFAYRLIKRMANIDIPLDCGDFSLVSRQVVDLLNQMPEESRFLRGMRSWLGFRQIGIPYKRDPRASGKPKYSLKMLMRLAFNGIFNFSELPVRFATYMGIFTLLVGGLYAGSVLVKKFFFGAVPTGFTGILVAVTLFGGVQLLFLGVVGEYILRIFFQVKNRPLFIVQSRIVEGKRIPPRPVDPES